MFGEDPMSRAPGAAKVHAMTAVDAIALSTAVALEGVTRSYVVGGADVVALADVSLTVAPGEFTVILGPSGSGKTTLLNLIGALDSPTSGRIVVGGRDITRASRRELFRFRRETVGFIFQTFNLFPALTARENVEFALHVARRSTGDGALRTLERVGLAERADHFPHELSGGEQQRVAIARAVATGSPVLLADEPTGELDFRTGVRILELLREQAVDGRCVLVVTHNREIARMADRVLELSGGRLVGDGPPPGGRPADVSELRW
jgi:putative ABC transport system ATP-binding protein